MAAEIGREILSILLNDDEKTITVRFRIELEGGVYIIVDRVFNIDDYNNIINLYGVIDVDNLFNYMMYGAEVEIDTGIDVEENYTIMTEEEVEEEIESFLDVLLLEIKDEILKPKILLLDEPTNALDEESEEKIVKILNSIKKSMIIVSHHKSFIEKLTPTIYKLNNQNLTLV